VTPADFMSAFPAFRDEQVPTIQRHLDAAAPFFDVDRWGAFYARGLGYFVAHSMVVEKAAGESKNETTTKGDVVSEEVGGMVWSRSADMLKAASRDPFLRTTYGQEYRRIARLVGLGGAVV